jgi:hypothetical protein
MRHDWIQYQQGLKDLAPASDLVEGTLNNVDRPPVFGKNSKQELYAHEALPHFNEVDECAGSDGLITYRLWRQLGFAPENTLHHLRWGRPYSFKDGREEYVWVFLDFRSCTARALHQGMARCSCRRTSAVDVLPLGGRNA